MGKSILPFKRSTSIKSEKGFMQPGLSDTQISPSLLKLKEEKDMASRISMPSPLAEDDAPAVGGDALELTEEQEREKIETFLKQNDYVATNIDKSASIKTNFYIVANNFTALCKYLVNLKYVVKWIYEHLQIDKLLELLIEKLQEDKTMIPVPFDIPIAGTRIYEVNKNTYKVTKIDSYVIQIECLTKDNWNVDRLMVQVKNNDYVIVYPRIATAENKIIIDFLDKVATNYMVFIL